MHAWRSLTGGGDTLIACSGGGDSVALCLALAAAGVGERLRIATVRHHERPRDRTDAEIELVLALGRRLGIACAALELPMATRATESAMRRARYALLEEHARALGVRFIATGHQADDQLETMLLALVRGAGPAGMRGIAPRRAARAGSEVLVVRPMLDVTRAEARALCAAAGQAFAEDPTNADTQRPRAALRAGVVPRLEALRGGVARRASRSAALFRDAAGLLEGHADASLVGACVRPGREFVWHRHELRFQRAWLVMEIVRRALRQCGARADALTLRALQPVARAIRDDRTEPRRFDLAGRTRCEVTAHRVRVWSAEPEAGPDAGPDAQPEGNTRAG